MDRRDDIKSKKDEIDAEVACCRYVQNIVYPVFFAAGGYLFAHIESFLELRLDDPKLLLSAFFFVWTAFIILKKHEKIMSLYRKRNEIK